MKRFSTLLLVLFASSLARSQTAVVTRNVNLRPDPSTKNTPVDKLVPPTQLQLLDPTPTNGFWHVRVNSESGWGWSKNVRIAQSPITGRGGEGSPATSISSEWKKPTPQTASFESDEGTCGSTGDGGDTDTNQRKNRTDVPNSYHPVTWDAINSLDYAKGAPKSRMDWTPAQLATIAPVEGVAISVEGYLFKVKVESSSPGAKSGGSLASTGEIMARDIISTPNAPSAPPTYSQAVRAGGLVFVSGTGPHDPVTGKIVGDTIQEQTRQCLQNVSAILSAAGTSLERVVSATVIVLEEGDFAGMNEEWIKWFPANPPARQGAKLPVRIPGMRVSIAAIAEV